jgi:hypothetical protein
VHHRYTAKKASRDLFPFGSRGWLNESFLYWFLGLQHFTPILRLPASPIGKEAVSKSEVIKSVCAEHNVVASSWKRGAYYRQESEKLSRQTWIDGHKSCDSGSTNTDRKRPGKVSFEVVLWLRLTGCYRFRISRPTQHDRRSFAVSQARPGPNRRGSRPLHR